VRTAGTTHQAATQLTAPLTATSRIAHRAARRPQPWVVGSPELQAKHVAAQRCTTQTNLLSLSTLESGCLLQGLRIPVPSSQHTQAHTVCAPHTALCLVDTSNGRHQRGTKYVRAYAALCFCFKTAHRRRYRNKQAMHAYRPTISVARAPTHLPPLRTHGSTHTYAYALCDSETGNGSRNTTGAAAPPRAARLVVDTASAHDTTLCAARVLPPGCVPPPSHPCTHKTSKTKHTPDRRSCTQTRTASTCQEGQCQRPGASHPRGAHTLGLLARGRMPRRHTGAARVADWTQQGVRGACAKERRRQKRRRLLAQVLQARHTKQALHNNAHRHWRGRAVRRGHRRAVGARAPRAGKRWSFCADAPSHPQRGPATARLQAQRCCLLHRRQQHAGSAGAATQVARVMRQTAAHTRDRRHHIPFVVRLTRATTTRCLLPHDTCAHTSSPSTAKTCTCTHPALALIVPMPQSTGHSARNCPPACVCLARAARTVCREKLATMPAHPPHRVRRTHHVSATGHLKAVPSSDSPAKPLSGQQ
jgi:hypothetical protein